MANSIPALGERDLSEENLASSSANNTEGDVEYINSGESCQHKDKNDYNFALLLSMDQMVKCKEEMDSTDLFIGGCSGHGLFIDGLTRGDHFFCYSALFVMLLFSSHRRFLVWRNGHWKLTKESGTEKYFSQVYFLSKI